MPDFIDDLTAGRGPLGFLQDDYQIVDRIRDAIEKQGVGGVLGLSVPVLDIVRSVVTAVVGVITIVFLTYFMLLDGPRTIERFSRPAPGDEPRPRTSGSAHDIYRTISGYVTGNLLISLVASVAFDRSSSSRSGASYAIALGRRRRDPRPDPARRRDASPRSSSRRSSSSRPTGSACLIVIAFFVGYQQFENHVLQPLVYGRTVELSPLAVLCAVLIGAQLAGILGALLAIPVAGSLLAIGREILQYRKELADAGEPEPEL